MKWNPNCPPNCPWVHFRGPWPIQDEARFCNIVCYLGGDDYLIFRTRQASATTLAFSLICPSSVTSRSWFEISISITNINTINDIATFMYCCFHQRLTITKVGPDKELVCAVRAVLAARRFLINMINIWGHGVRPAKSFRRLYFSFSVQCSCIFSTRTARYNWFFRELYMAGKTTLCNDIFIYILPLPHHAPPCDIKLFEWLRSQWQHQEIEKK